MTVRLGFPGAGVPGLVQLTIRASPIGRALPVIDFDIADITFTAGMAKRDAPGPFDRAPLAQGKWATTGTPDTAQLPAGTQQLGNAAATALAQPTIPSFTSIFDYHQGTISFWLTPEWDGNDGKSHFMFFPYANDFGIWKFTNNFLYCYIGLRQTSGISTAAWTAGTTYHIVVRWSTHATLDGTNYVCVSVNDAHTFSVTTAPNVYGLSARRLFTNQSGTLSIDSIVEGFTLYRRILWDGTYGDYIGIADEINAIYNAGAGTDPTEITGSWDVTFCLPTNQADQSLQTTGEAWSHPHGSNILDARSTGEENCFACDGGYLGGPYAIWGNAATINCGNANGLDDLHAADFTYESWVRYDSPGSTRVIARKGDGSATIGWSWQITNVYQISAIANYDAGDAFYTSPVITSKVLDDKWHHFAATLVFATRTISVWWDGEYLGSNSGAGNPVSDVGQNFFIGLYSGASPAGRGWVRVSTNIRYTAGVDFIAPRQPPAVDGNTLAQWNFTEGTGLTLDNAEGTASRDGTIVMGVNGAWISTWDMEGTPPILPVLEYDGAATSTVITDAARIQDLHDNAFTVEAWVRADSDGEGSEARIFDKTASGSDGWIFLLYPSTTLTYIRGFVFTDTVNGDSRGAITGYGYQEWNHVAMQYDDAGDRKVYLWINGIPANPVQTAATGNVASDVGLDLYLGNRSDGARTWDGAFGGWARVSSVLRYTNGVPFVPPDMANPPAADANTAWQTDFPDGAGTTLTDASAGANNGTITFGTGRWYNWVDAETIASGHRMYQWGYMLASDGANDGIDVISQTGLTAGSNYVGRVPVKYGYSRRAQPRIRVYDETNGATIVDFDGPPLVGTHLVGAASATLVVTGAVFPYSLVGGKVYNIPDGSVGTITAVGGTNQDTITAPLAGGGSNDWNVGEQYMIVPPDESNWSWCEHFCWELPTIARNGVAADCTQFSVKLLNVSGEGVLYWQQAEVQPVIIDNPGCNPGAGNPWIPDGWTVGTADPGDTSSSAAGGGVIHSGADAIQVNPVIASNDYIYPAATVPAGTFVSLGGWFVGDGATGVVFRAQAASKYTLQRSLSTDYGLTCPGIAVWQPVMYVAREVDPGANDHRPAIWGDAALVANAYADDIYSVLLDPITLTVTPASQANSLEGPGIRLDGDDDAPANVPVGDITATYGHIRWGWTPRHDAAELFSFGDDSTAIHVWGDANNYIRVYATAANQITLEFNDGGGVHTVNWNCAGAITADTLYLMELVWGAANMRLIQDSVTVAQIVQPVNFATVPTIIYWGNSQGGNRGSDAVFSTPA